MSFIDNIYRDDLLAVVKFSKSRVWDKVPEGSTLIFGGTQIFLHTSVGQVEGSLHAKNQLNRFSHFSRIPTCDRHIHVHIDLWTDCYNRLFHCCAECLLCKHVSVILSLILCITVLF